jgi:head-tail adaptor
MSVAGSMSERFRFDRRVATGDQYGGGETAFSPVFETSASRRFLRGGEAVLASRLEGRQPVLLTIRSSLQSREITSAWRAVDARSGESYNVTAVNPGADRQWIEILAISGAGDG